MGTEKMNDTERSPDAKAVVITGGTRGIGFGLARELLLRGCGVTISGRGKSGLDDAVRQLTGTTGKQTLKGIVCDVRDPNDHQALWDTAVRTFGRVDIWINNAGVAHPQKAIQDLQADEIRTVIETNVTGSWYGCRVAVQGMMAQGHGFIYNMEGLGSDGRQVPGLGLYGSSKAALAYLTRVLIKELKGSPVKAGLIRPGMVMTDMITAQYRNRPKDWNRAKKIFNILADRPETVTPWLAEHILADNPHGVKIEWLTRMKAFWRFLLAPILKRNVVVDIEG